MTDKPISKADFLEWIDNNRDDMDGPTCDAIYEKAQPLTDTKELEDKLAEQEKRMAEMAEELKELYDEAWTPEEAAGDMVYVDDVQHIIAKYAKPRGGK